jgi:hypothetical protein
MPNPSNYKNTEKGKFMQDCMHQTLKVEKKDRDQSIAQCLGTWKNRNKKKRKKCASEILRSIVAKLGVLYKSNSVQVNLPKDLSSKIIAWGRKNIPDEDLVDDSDHSKGRENSLHITALYGIKDNIPEVVEELLESVPPFEVTLGKISVFRDSPDHDVVKIEIDSPELFYINYLLRDNISYENKYPVYNPHCTICYVEKGKADKFIGDTVFEGRIFKVDKLEFSGLDGKKTMIKLLIIS